MHIHIHAYTHTYTYTHTNPQSEVKTSVGIAIKAIATNSDLWERYFHDISHEQLKLWHYSEHMASSIIEASISPLCDPKLEPVERMSKLHMCLHMNKLNILQYTCLLQPLMELDVMTERVSYSDTQDPIVTGQAGDFHAKPEDMCTFVINTLFTSLVSARFSESGSANSFKETMMQWYNSYCSMVSYMMKTLCSICKLT